MSIKCRCNKDIYGLREARCQEKNQIGTGSLLPSFSRRGSCIVTRKCTRQWALFRNFPRTSSARRSSSLILYAARGSGSYSETFAQNFHRTVSDTLLNAHEEARMTFDTPSELAKCSFVRVPARRKCLCRFKCLQMFANIQSTQ